LTEDCRPEQKQQVQDMLTRFYPNYLSGTKPLLVIYGGYFYDRFWNGKMFYENQISLGGSESMVIKLAHLLSDKYNVYVFLNTQDDILYNNVNYIKVEKYDIFLDINRAKHLILSRDSSKTHTNAEKTHLWLHDLVNIGELKDSKEYTNIITLTKFHKEFFENILKQNNKKEYISKLKVIPNISDGGDKIVSKKAGYRFIYSSCPTRGLIKVLEDFPKIKEAYPDAELFIYSDFNNDYVKSRMDVNDLLVTIALMKGVYNVGRLPEQLFLEEVKKCNYWYYPTEFLETFCITAVQMMNYGVIPIYRPVGSLPNVIQQGGVKIEKEENIVEVLAKIKNHKHLLTQGFDISKRYSSKNVKKMWQELL